MGDQGCNSNVYLQNLQHSIAGAQLESLTAQDFVPLWVLRDLRKHMPKEVTLAEKIIQEWKGRSQEGKNWPITELGAFISTYWSNVRSARAAMSGGKKNPTSDPGA